MPLFPPVPTANEVEEHLKRPLNGDPTRGERGVLVALTRRKVADVRRSLELDDTLKPDFKELVAEYVLALEQRWQGSKGWRVQVPLPVWDEYARESRMSQRPIGECLSAGAGGRRRVARSRVGHALRRPPRHGQGPLGERLAGRHATKLDVRNHHTPHSRAHHRLCVLRRLISADQEYRAPERSVPRVRPADRRP